MTRLPFEFFLGLRYLKPKRSFVSVIPVTSIGGVAIGVWILIVVIAVMSGFDRELRQKLVELRAHVTVTGGIITNGESVIKTIMQTPRVKAASPFVLGLVLVEFNHRVAAPYMKGIDPLREAQVTSLTNYVKEGSLDLEGDKVVIGGELARECGIFVGDKITVYSARNIEKKGEEVYLPLELTVTGIFESGMYEYDVGFILTSLATAQELYNLNGGIHGIAVRTDDPITGAQQVATALEEKLPGSFHVQTWMQQSGSLLGAIENEKGMMFLILSLISVVAAFCIMCTLVTVAVQKTNEIGILKACGATPFFVARLFVLQGFTVGLIGVTLGMTLGLLTVQHIDQVREFLSWALHRDLFPREIYNFSHIPTYLTRRDLWLIGLVAQTIATLGGVIPALWAARLEPVEALQHE